METDGCIKLTWDTFIDQLPLSETVVTNEINNESRVFPRIGEEYQAEIPNIATEDEFFQRKISSLGFDYPIETGLDIPISWIVPAKEEQNVLSDSNICASKDESKQHKLETEGQIDAGSEKFTGSLSEECALSENKIERSERYIPLPCSASSLWTDAETQSFLLGLYIFGKNLFHVRNFVECKTIGAILSLYYGKFYGSDDYRRWSERRKKRSGRCIFGPRIFIGWRQQELLSRLLSAVLMEVQDPLMEVFKAFNENRSSFMEFISALKTTVGIQAFVEAIGIGRGKHDLTRIILDSARANQVSSIRTDIPIGKSCSSLSSRDIIKFLTGDFRLSKARSTDLFWEAVWPRLLARGWRSEKPKDLGSGNSKHALVFLIPGARKFSRKKLVKGNHYFDSVSDVLGKVASDPRLLELEAEEVNDNGQTMDTGSERNPLPDNQRRCYLSPQFPDNKSELMKFTVVDTSLAGGEPPFKMRDLRSLPVDAIFKPCTNSDKTRSDGSEENLDSDDSSSDKQGEAGHSVFDSMNLENGYVGIEGTKSDAFLDITDNGQISLEKGCILNSIMPLEDTTCQFNVAPLSKKRRLSGLCSSFSKADTDQQRKYSIDLNVTPQPRACIDLNLPHAPSEDESDEHFCVPSHNKDRLNTSDAESLPVSSWPMEPFVPFDEQSSLNSRRQSTRSRPPTTRALEALACGFLGMKSKCRDMNAPSPTSSSIKRSRRKRKPVEVARPLPVDIDSIGCAVIGDAGALIDGWHEISAKNTVGLSGSTAQSNGKDAHELLWLS